MAGITLAALVTKVLISIAVSFVLTVISRALAPDPKQDTPNGNRGGWRARIFQSKNPFAPRDIIYGEVRKSGTVVYEEVTSDGKFLHTVIVLGTGEVEAIPIVFLDDTPIYDVDMNSKGRVVKGKFAEEVYIKKYLGSSTQVADTLLIDESDGHWTSSHKLQGICYIYVRLRFNRDVFSAQPAISAYIKGKKVNDIRNTTPAAYSPNPALAFRDYITTEIKDMGVGFEGGDIDDLFLAATANNCDEFVTVSPISYDVSSIDGDEIFLEPNAKAFALQTGDRVTYAGATRYVAFLRPFLSDIHEKHGIKLATSYERALAGTTTTLPPSGGGTTTGGAIPGKPGRPSLTGPGAGTSSISLSTTQSSSGGTPTRYRWRYVRTQGSDSPSTTTSTGPTTRIDNLQVNTGYTIDVRAENSAGNSAYSTSREFSTQGATRGSRGQTNVPRAPLVVVKIAEPRYTCSGVIESARTPRDNMADMLSAMGGKAVYTQGKWKVRAAVYTSPLIEYDESDIVSKVDLQTKHSLRERFNAVKGQYIGPTNLGVPAEYPQIKNAFYQTEDGGERIFGTLDLPFTSRPHTAQRLAKIKLEEHRQSIVFKSSFKLTALAVQPTDTIFLSIPRLGWDRKPFEIIEWEFVGKNDDKSVPVYTVDMTLKETASGIYDWNMGEETTVDLAPNTNLANPLSPVTGITVEFEVIIGEDGTAYTRMKVCWDAHPSPAVASYSMEYRKTGDLTWTPGGSVNTPSTCIIVEPVEPGAAYEVRVRARNFTGLDSPYGYFTSSGVVGDRTAPGDPTNIDLDPNPGGYFITWENPKDLDLDVIEIWEREIP